MPLAHRLAPLFLAAGILAGADLPPEGAGTGGQALGALLRPVPRTAVFREEGYDVWCGSLVRGTDGRYHLFYSRWPTRLGHEAWVTHSEVARAVGDSPFGPFTPMGPVLPARGPGFWDGSCTHNPTVLAQAGRYYLYYMGNRGNGEYWDHRNHQRIGVAVADTPEGPWQRTDAPVLANGAPGEADAVCVTNPAVVVHPDGRVLMVYKAVADRRKAPRYGPVVNFTAWADRPEGPFRKTGVAAFTDPRSEFPAEDACLWWDGARFQAVVKDMAGLFTRAGTSLAQFTSDDGQTWRPAPVPLVCDRSITWADGQRQEVSALERPQIFLERGRPAALLVAVAEGTPRTRTFNLQIPLGVTP